MPRSALVLAVLAIPVAAVVAATAGPAAAQPLERCYGVALAGRNDGIGTDSAPGTAVADFQGDAWTWTPAGRCPVLALPPQADGTPRRGAYLPLARDLP